MQFQIRRISLLLRQSDSAKDRRRVLRAVDEWKEVQRSLPAPHPIEEKLLLIRLDDIGDYLLFRNQLDLYKKSPRWKDYRITLLGNASWRELFSLLDQDAVDEVIWVKKNEYLDSAPYRLEVWERLRKAGFDTVIAPSRTRPLLLDDFCMLAAAPRHTIASANTYAHARWNQLSDSLYAELFTPPDPLIHEFHFNGQFAAWSCGIRYAGKRPGIDYRSAPPVPQPYIICFIGATTRSKRWPAKRWIEFIELYRRRHSERIFLAGGNAAEIAMARAIQEHTGADSIAGQVTLPELLRWVGGAQTVVTNDTMAAHMSISLGRPTVIVANGVNYRRFTEYGIAGIERVATLYPRVFNRRRARLGEGPYEYTEAVSADIASIEANDVVDKLQEVLEAGPLPAGGVPPSQAASTATPV